MNYRIVKADVGCYIFLTDWLYWNDKYDALVQWCDQYDCGIEGLAVNVPNQRTLSLWLLQWG